MLSLLVRAIMNYFSHSIFVIVLMTQFWSLNAVTIDFDSGAYAIPDGKLSCKVNGVDGWESQDFLGFLVRSPGIGTGQALGFGPKYVLPSSANETITRDLNIALTGESITNTPLPSTPFFGEMADETGDLWVKSYMTPFNGYDNVGSLIEMDFMIHRPEKALGNDAFDISLIGNLANERISFSFDPNNLSSEVDGDLGIDGKSNLFYNSVYKFYFYNIGQNYITCLGDAFGNYSNKISGTLTSTAITSFSLGYSIADPSTELTSASDAYIIIDNLSARSIAVRVDKDGDGWRDDTEILFGSSHEDINSVPNFDLRTKLKDNGEIELSFPAQKGKIHKIQVSKDMREWAYLDEGEFAIYGDGNIVTRSFKSSGSREFFRVTRN